MGVKRRERREKELNAAKLFAFNFLFFLISLSLSLSLSPPQAILKHTPEDHPDGPAIRRLYSSFVDIVKACNAALREKELGLELQRLQNSLDTSRLTNVRAERGREEVKKVGKEG